MANENEEKEEKELESSIEFEEEHIIVVEDERVKPFSNAPTIPNQTLGNALSATK